MNNEEFEKRLKQKIEQWDEPLTPNIEGRLRAARRSALDANNSLSRNRTLLGGASYAAVAVVAFGLLQVQQSERPVSAPVDDMRMLTSGDEFELYDEMEFMLWLEEHGDEFG